MLDSAAVILSLLEPTVYQNIMCLAPSCADAKTLVVSDETSSENHLKIILCWSHAHRSGLLPLRIARDLSQIITENHNKVIQRSYQKMTTL